MLTASANPAITQSPIEAQLLAELDRLVPGALVTWDHGHGMFAVWDQDDLIGTGECRSEAIQDAMTTARGWAA